MVAATKLDDWSLVREFGEGGRNKGGIKEELSMSESHLVVFKVYLTIHVSVRVLNYIFSLSLE